MSHLEAFDQKIDLDKKKLITIIEDDQVIFSNILRYFELIDDFKAGINCNSVEAYFEKLQEFPDYQPDIILLDIGLPGMSGLDAIPKILQHSPNSNIIMLTTFEEEQKVLKAMCSGAVAYLSKKTSLKKIVETIRIVNNGGSYMTPSIARDIFNFMLTKNSKKKESLLSERQTQVLKGMVDGNTYTQIAEELFISPLTVRTHFKNIYKILHVNNKAEAIAKYLKGELYR
jgi:DNA-binding NarL/FixJ family response regulator